MIFPAHSRYKEGIWAVQRAEQPIRRPEYAKTTGQSPLREESPWIPPCFIATALPGARNTRPETPALWQAVK